MNKEGKYYTNVNTNKGLLGSYLASFTYKLLVSALVELSHQTMFTMFTKSTGKNYAAEGLLTIVVVLEIVVQQ